jgi:hypothetical protein
MLKIDDEEGEIRKVRHVHVCEHAKINSDSNRSWASIFAFFFFFFLENSVFASDIPRNPLHVKDWVGGGRPWCPRGEAVATPNFFFLFDFFLIFFK